MRAAGTFLDRLAVETARHVGPVRPLLGNLKALHEGFTRARGRRAPDYLRSGPSRRAYLASLALPNAARALHVLSRSRAGLRSDERALDAGAGTGAAALALAALSDPGAEILLLDRSDPALAEAAALFAALFPSGPRVTTLRRRLGPAAPPRGPFDVVLAGHLLNELLPPRGREPGPALDTARALAGRVARGGRLVFLEPAQRIPSRALCRIRADLLGGGWIPLFPCTACGPCPVLAGGARDWCVVDVPWRRPGLVREIDRLLGTDRRKITVSALVLGRDARPLESGSQEVLGELMRTRRGRLQYLCGEGGRAVLRMPVAPDPPLLRGSRIRLPAGIRPKARDRTGAPILDVHPRDIERR